MSSLFLECWCQSGIPVTGSRPLLKLRFLLQMVGHRPASHDPGGIMAGSASEGLLCEPLTVQRQEVCVPSGGHEGSAWIPHVRKTSGEERVLYSDLRASVSLHPRSNVVERADHLLCSSGKFGCLGCGEPTCRWELPGRLCRRAGVSRKWDGLQDEPVQYPTHLSPTAPSL